MAVSTPGIGVPAESPVYNYITPTVAVGANKLYFDMFNAVGSGVILDVQGIWAIPDTAVAVTGLVGVRLDLFRTSTVGTGGTAAAYKSATVDVAGGNITPVDTTNPSPGASITIRWLPTGGAAIAEWLTTRFSLGEESPTSMAYLTQSESLIQRAILREGQGILVKQGAVASAGNLKFYMQATFY